MCASKFESNCLNSFQNNKLVKNKLTANDCDADVINNDTFIKTPENILIELRNTPPCIIPGTVL